MMRHRISPHWRWTVLPALGLLLAACSPGATGPTNWPGVSSSQDHIFVANGPKVYAVSLDGRQLWSYPTEAVRDVSYFAAPTVAEDGLVYAVAYQGHVVALDGANGDLVWEYLTTGGDNGAADGRIIASPAIAGDLLLVPTDGGTMFFLDRHTGELVRTFEDGGQLWSKPQVEGDVAYVASLGHILYAIDVATAEPLWPADLGYAIADTPTFVDGTLFSGVLGDSLVLVNAEGEELWRVATEGWVWGSPAVADGLAVFGDAIPASLSHGRFGHVYAIDLASRTMHWQKETAATSTSPLLVGELAIFGFEDKHLIAYDTVNGGVRWDATAFAPLNSDPVLAGDLVIVAVTSKEALLQAFHVDSGASAWNFLPAGG
jgi:outer membrane protein assembly factor BamB